MIYITVEKLFRWVPGHTERVETRRRLGITGVHKALDIVVLGKLSRKEAEAYEEGQRWTRQNIVLPFHNFLYDLTHPRDHDQE